MTKSEIRDRILDRLRAELALLTNAALATHSEATDEQNRAENKYDTRGLEASYLAHGQSKAAEEAALAVAQFQSLVLRDFGPADPIGLGALVRLDNSAAYFIGPRAGGTEVSAPSGAVMVVTPQSPLGRQVLGRRTGDEITLSVGAKSTRTRIVSVT